MAKKHPDSFDWKTKIWVIIIFNWAQKQKLEFGILFQIAENSCWSQSLVHHLPLLPQSVPSHDTKIYLNLATRLALNQDRRIILSVHWECVSYLVAYMSFIIFLTFPIW